MIVALGAVALIGVAALATLFPFGRFISGGLACVGLVGGIASLGAEGRAKLAGGVAIGLHFLLLLVLVFLPSWLGLDPMQGFVIPETPPAPVAFVHATQKTMPVEWVDSSTSSWQFKDVRVTVERASLSPMDLLNEKDDKRLSKDKYLQLVVRIANFGVERPLELSGWATGNQADPIQPIQLTDSSGKTVTEAVFPEGWSPEPFTPRPSPRLFPGKFSEVRFVFAPPQAKIEYLRLVMPGTTFGFQDPVKFQIPFASVIQPGLPRR